MPTKKETKIKLEQYNELFENRKNNKSTNDLINNIKMNNVDQDIVDFFTHHNNLAFVIQLLAPIFLGFFGSPDFRSFFDGNQPDNYFVKSSSRSFTNRLNNAPFIGLSQFPTDKKLFNMGREYKYCKIEEFTNQYILKLQTINKHINENNLGCDINRRIDKNRDNFFGFEIRNVEFNGHTDLEYYRLYIQIVFLLSYYVEKNNTIVTKQRESLQYYYNSLIDSLINVLKNGFYANLDNEYINYVRQILQMTSLKEILENYFNGNCNPKEMLIEIYNHLFDLFKPDGSELFKTYYYIIGNRITNYKCPNAENLKKIVYKYMTDVVAKKADNKEYIYKLIEKMHLIIVNYDNKIANYNLLMQNILQIMPPNYMEVKSIILQLQELDRTLSKSNMDKLTLKLKQCMKENKFDNNFDINNFDFEGIYHVLLTGKATNYQWGGFKIDINNALKQKKALKIKLMKIFKL